MYPEKPLCHEINPVFTYADHITWEFHSAESDKGYQSNLRHCSYCGSVHPEDLLKLFEEGAFLEGSDWKYGWPHKYYVENVPNPRAGQQVVVSSRSWTDPDTKERKSEDTYGPASPTMALKFYTEHLKDLFDQPEFEVVARAVHAKFSGIFYPRVAFVQEGDRLKYISGGNQSYDEKLQWALEQQKNKE